MMDPGARIEVNLTGAELALLVELLEQVRSDLRLEIRHSFLHEYRKILVSREEVLEGLVDRLAAILSHQAA